MPDSYGRPKLRLSDVVPDPGTPQMQTAWSLIVRSGVLAAQLLQGDSARFAGGAYKVKEVRLDRGVLPDVRMPDVETKEGTRKWFSLPAATSIIGENAAFRDTLARAARIAQCDISVLIRGETGTGKGRIARLIHDTSPRKNQPFVSLNCAAITASLVESEFFGHAKGAFTGASTQRMGLFRSADGGTIFRGEIGDLPQDGVNPRAYMHQLEGRFYRAAMERSNRNGEQAVKLLGLNGPDFRKAWKERFGGD